MNVAGVEIADPSRVAGLVQQQLEGTGPWSSPSDRNPVDGMQRAAHRAGTLQPDFARALMELAEHRDAAVRAGALASMWAVAEHVDPDRLLDLLEQQRDLFAGVAKPAGYPIDADDLEGAMVLAIAKSARAGATRSNQFLMKQLEQSGSLHVLLALARATPDWLAANAARLVPRSAIGGVLRALPEAHQRSRVVRALAPWPGDDGRALVAKPAWTGLPLSAGEKGELEALILGTRSPSMPTVRSSHEAHAYMDLHPCPGCGDIDFERRSSVEADDRGTIAVYEGRCHSCNTPRRFALGLSAELPPGDDDDAVSFGRGRSTVFDPGDFLALADLYARRNRGIDDMRRAIGALDQVIGAIPDGADRVPEDVFFTEHGKRVREREPGRFRRARLEAVRDTYRDVLNRERG